ncbi:MAG: cytochrome c biogenesis protein ResB [Terriglobales bacterium]
MALSLRSVSRKTWQTLSSIKTGVILIILVVIFSIAGTVILQRPMTEADDMQRAYSPAMLRFLDAMGLTDVFHAPWFLALLVLVSLCIVAASIQRFPNSWRYFARPYKSPDEGFRKALPTQARIPIPDDEQGLSAAERAFKHLHLKTERIVRPDSFSLFAERNRISEMAVYIVHASLLLIFLGYGVVDALYGWRGFLTLTPGTQSNQVEVRNGDIRALPFSIRCDGTGEETYTDGTPKRWWSKLAVVDNGREVERKEIVVNDPLVYHGVRFYQASWGRTGKLDALILNAKPAGDTTRAPQEISLALNQTVALDTDTSVQLVEFIPDYVVQDGHVYARSNDVANPAVHMIVTSKKANRSVNVWLPEIPDIAENASSPYIFEPKDLQTGVFTGLQVSHKPGQWSVWAGVVLIAIGLTFVFYLSHVRFWVVPVADSRGQLALWVGGTANRNRDAFEQKFKQLVEQIQKELKPATVAPAPAQATTTAGR